MGKFAKTCPTPPLKNFNFCLYLFEALLQKAHFPTGIKQKPFLLKSHYFKSR